MQFLNSLEGKKIIIFGTGKAAEALIPKLSVKIDYFVDNDSKRCDRQFMSRAVKNPNVLLAENKGSIYILVASMYYNEISDQLKHMGFKEFIDYYNSMDLIINPIEHFPSMVINEESSRLSTKVKNLIAGGFTEDAKTILAQYENIAPFDQRIGYLRALLDLKENRLHNVESFLWERIKDCELNIGLNVEINRVLESTQANDYVQAVDICESLLFNVSQDKHKRYLIDKINEIESTYREEICEQLNKIVRNDDKKNGRYHLHLMMNHFHSRGVFEFIKNHFNMSDQKFVVFTFNGNKDYFQDADSRYLHRITIMPDNHEEIADSLKGLFADCKQVFFHYLHDFFCWLICRCNLRHNLNWVLWGGDLHIHIDQKLYDCFTEALVNRIGLKPPTDNEVSIETEMAGRYRKSAIRRMSNIIAWPYDYDIILNNFITAARSKKYFHRILIDIDSLDETVNISGFKYNFKSRYKHVILLGNSADPSNNHLDVILKLSNMKLDDFCVVTPLSYGGTELYKKEIIAEGKKLLGERFIPLLEFLSPEDYAKVLSQVDIAVMNHFRQQAGNNVAVLLYMGKKVYLKTDGVIYRTFKDLGIVLYDIDSLWNSDQNVFSEMETSEQCANKRAIEKLLDLEEVKRNFEAAML